MPGKRAEGQKLLPIPANEEFITKLDEGVRRVRYPSRSQFIRDAIVEKLHDLGIEMPAHLAKAPDRMGKGGPINYRKKPKPLNLLPDPNLPSKIKSAADALTKAADKKIRHQHKSKTNA